MGIPDPARGETLGDMGIRQAATMATIIFAGTVKGIDYEKASAMDSVQVTKITFDSVRFADSVARDSLVTVTLFGGAGIGVEGMPTFQKGERYLLFLSDLGSPSDWFMPIIGMDQGAFRVERGTGNVRDWRGRYLAGIGDGLIDVVDSTMYRRQWSQPEGHPLIVRHKGGEVTRTWPDSAYAAPIARYDYRGKLMGRMFPAKGDPGTRVTEAEFLKSVNDLKLGH